MQGDDRKGGGWGVRQGNKTGGSGAGGWGCGGVPASRRPNSVLVRGVGGPEKMWILCKRDARWGGGASRVAGVYKWVKGAGRGRLQGGCAEKGKRGKRGESRLNVVDSTKCEVRGGRARAPGPKKKGLQGRGAQGGGVPAWTDRREQLSVERPCVRAGRGRSG